MNTERRVVQVPAGYRLGDWQTTHHLASGSWSSVYAAERQPVTAGSGAPRRAALKFVPTGTLTARQLAHLADMTNRELALHRTIAHPRLIGLLETHVVDDPEQPRLDGATVLVLEQAEQSTAARLSAVQGGLPDAPRIIAEICAGLAHLHAAGWVHGDLKPSNVLLMADGSVRLADFGLAAEIDGTHAYLPPGGTADYTPPERALEGMRTNGVAVRQTADIWALGVTACQLLTGRLPFPGVTSRARSASAAAYAAGRADLTLPAGLSPEWRAFIADCLSPDHARRQRHTAASLHRRAVDADRRLGRWSRLTRRIRHPSRRTAVGAAAVAVLAAGATGLVVTAPWEHTSPDRHPQLRGLPAHGRRTRPVPGPDPSGRNVLSGEQGGHPAADRRDAQDGKQLRPEPGRPGERRVRHRPVDAQRAAVPPTGRAAGRHPGTAVLAGDVDPRRRTVPVLHVRLELEAIPGDPAINLAAAYRTSAGKVREANGVPHRPAVEDYIKRLRVTLEALRPTA